MAVMFGCDPEFTIRTADGKPVPAHKVGFEPASPGWGSNGSYKLFRDGFNLELNALPSSCRALLLNSVTAGLRVARELVAQGSTGYVLSASAAYEVDLSQLKNAPPDVKHFGCHPSMNAYTMSEGVVDIDAMTHNWRYAGGHLHFGTEATNIYGYAAIQKPENHELLVKLFDKFIGVPLSVLYSDDSQWRRRKFYGKAGEFRYQHYSNQWVGIEYRTPPPELFNHVAVISLFMGVGRYIIKEFAYVKELWKPEDTEKVQVAINTGKGAAELLGTVPGFYEPSTILQLRERPEIRVLNPDVPECHRGWSEYAEQWEVKGPITRMA